MTMANGNGVAADFITVGEGNDARRIAVALQPPAAGNTLAHFVWLGGYRSDMSGTKAIELAALAARLGTGCVRFDYSGHGISGGAFVDGTISRWLEESLAVIDHAASTLGSSRIVLVGSSMGGWIALRAVAELAGRSGIDIAGLVLIAPAPDFTSELIEPNLTETERAALAERGQFEEPTPYGPDPNIYTLKLIEDGRANRVLTGAIETGCPVHILQGMADPDVPYAHAVRLMEHLSGDDVVLTLIRDGDHRLSRPQDIAKILEAAETLARGT
ncbi:alpha/beta fold hydrolase [Shinella zoogloeoides]|uniref:Palmitoyl-protein thioesterase ABHD10, mitochondrial n=2 Tax=Shinella zoogloeoides TaxID=352475 RepID=A0A6N8TDM7_SHIZO|nr:alpha/beta hydrolase [Shinella zoogloeoides]MXO01363.1 alpha/beta fold hydrolase [Shinella zoogloeoides]UEX81540.1 alpha/beta hydrolase [Shinella zoogloeoides]